MLLGSVGILRQHRRMRILPILPILLAGACGGSNDNPGPSGGGADAAIDSSPGGGSGSGGPTIKITGKAVLLSTDGTAAAVSGATISAYATTDEATAVATAMSGTDGSYTLTVPAGAPLDGFLKGTSKDNADTYLYPPAALTADFAGADINFVLSTQIGLLPVLGGGAIGSSAVALEVVESAATRDGVADATVDAAPKPGTAKVVYADANGVPDRTGGKTLGNGRAFIFGLADGAATISATKTGVTFKPTTIKVHAGALVTTVVTE
jgi:hypothetical protein